MSSIKSLKKEVEGITYEVVSDCFTFMLVNEKKEKKKIQKYIEEAISLRNNLILRINNYAKEKETGNRKQYFNKIKEDLYFGMDKTLKNLSNLSQK